MIKEKLLVMLLSTSVMMGLCGLLGRYAYAAELPFEEVDYIKQNEIRVIKDDSTIEFDVKPQMIKNRTLVPMRAIFEEMKLEVEWNQKEQLAIGFDENNKIIFKINSTTAKINNVEKTLDVPAQIIKGRTLIPLRFLSENMGYNVLWIQESNLILISDHEISDEWKYAGQEKDDPNKNYQRRYINGFKTPFTRYEDSSEVLYGVHDMSDDEDEKENSILSGRVTAQRLNFRKINSMSSSIIGFIEEGSIVKILETDGEWLKIEYDGQTGWVYKDYVDITDVSSEDQNEETDSDTIKGIVNTDDLNLREGSGVDYAVIQELDKGTVLEILKTEGYWLNVQYDGKTGWVHKSYVDIEDSSSEDEKTETIKGVVNTDELNLREGNGVNYAVIHKLEKDDVVEILNAQGYWLNVEYDGQKGWVHKEFIEIVNDDGNNQDTEDIFKIYLSPSNQPSNLYATGNITEKEEMEKLADRIKNILLDEYVCDVKIGSDLGDSYAGRPNEAENFGADVYLAIHSNASANKVETGAMGFYHPDYLKSWILTNNIIDEINDIDPYESITFLQIRNGMDAFDGFGLGEIRAPHKLGLMPVLIETEYHDNPITANWIIDNTDAIARAYVNGLVKTFNLPLK